MENPGKGEILSFESETLPIFASYNKPYSAPSEWGTLIKLYEYQTKFKQNVQGHGGLLRPLDLLAPDLGLPFRLHECRYEGTPGSFEHQVNGLRVRLHDDKGNVLEQGFPTSCSPTIDGQKLSISIYAFKDDKARTYRNTDKGVIFTLNGQSQGWLDDRIFIRNKVGLGFLRNSLLVIVDCSDLDYAAQENLFVNDRAHLRKTAFRDRIEDAVIDYLAHHQGLADLQEDRKRKLKADRIDNARPLEEILSKIIKNSKTLAQIFLKGERLSNPFKSSAVQAENVEYTGKPYPTYFRFKKLNYGEVLSRTATQGNKCRILFETDATNDYFERKVNPGTYDLFVKKADGSRIEAKRESFDFSLDTWNGLATLSINIGKQQKIGEKLVFMLSVTDPMRIAEPPFENECILTIQEAIKTESDNKSSRTRPPSSNKGNDRDAPGGLKLPPIIPVYEKDWHDHQFDKFSAVKAIKERGEGDAVGFTFFVNMDNLYLQHEVKDKIKDKEIIETHFTMGMAILGISLIYDQSQFEKDKKDDVEIEELIFRFSRAMAPMMIPMIRDLGGLNLKNEFVE